MKIEDIVPLNENINSFSLPYAKGALAPHISKHTLTIHYEKHYRGYVKKLNELIKDTEFENMKMEDIVKKSSGPIFNNAAQAWNHEFYWKCMAPGTPPPVPPSLTKAIDKSFGSFDSFKEKFIEEATSLFGSGWVWLVKKGNSLAIVPMENAGCPLTKNLTPLLVCDVWEHAYYLDYKNDRNKYVNEFMTLIDWSFVQANHPDINK